jgi:hypothetical protein
MKIDSMWIQMAACACTVCAKWESWHTKCQKPKCPSLILPPRSRRATWQLIYTLNPQTNINTFHPVVAILSTVQVVQGTTWPTFHFFQFLSNDDGQCLKFSLKRDGRWEQGEPVCWSFFFVLQEVISVNFTGLWEPTRQGGQHDN